MRLLGCAALLITLGTVNACALLPELEPGVCGNGVVEAQAGEECDGFPLDGKTLCIKPDEKNACRIPCDLDVEPHLRCPAGYACGLNELCRAPSGTFNEAPSSYVEEDVLQILLGDFDGDRVKDVLTTGAAEQRIHYYDKSGALVTRSSIPGSYARPAVGQLTHGGDSADDFTIGVGPGISVMRGQPGRSAAATQYPVPLVNTKYAYSLFALEVNALDESSPGHEVLGVFQEYGKDMAFVGNASNASGELLPEAIGPAFPILGPLAGEVTTGNLFENGPGALCEEAVFGFFGGKQIYVIAPCGSPKAVQLDLPGDAVLLSQPRLGDMNNDGLADIVFGGLSKLDVGGSNQKCHFVGIAYNKGDGQFASDPNLLNLGAGPALVADYVDGQTCLTEDTPFLFPLAAGDVNNDGAGDYIDPYGVHINSGGPKQLPTFALKDVITPVATLWTSAQIAEFTGDSFPDVVAGSELIHGIDFLLGTGSPTLPFNKIKIETPYPTGKITAGFFDGDLILDVAIAERIPLDEKASPTTSGNALSILFGRQFAAPEPPVRMGQMDKIHQIIPGNFNQYTNVSDFTTDLLVVSGRSEAPVFGGPVAAQMGAPVPSTFFLVGSADRRILSPYRLHTGDGPTHPILTVTGQFDGDKEGNADVAVLSAEEITLEGSSGSDAEEQDYRIWLLPTYSGAEIPMLDIEATSPRATLSDAFGAQAIGPEAGTLEIPSIKAAVVDLEGDGVDEIVAFIPVQGNFDTVSPVAFKLWTLVLRTETVMEQESGIRRFTVAAEAEFDDLYFPLRVESVDINGDGLRDIVGLFYDPPEEPNVLPSSRIVAFVNKGDGSTSMTYADMPTPMDETADPKNPVEDFPYAFAVLNADTDPSTDIVVFTKSYAYTSELDAAGAALTKPVRNASLPGAIAAGAGDMTGDGVDDLVVSDGLSLRMFKGQPTTPDPR